MIRFAHLVIKFIKFVDYSLKTKESFIKIKILSKKNDFCFVMTVRLVQESKV